MATLPVESEVGPVRLRRITRLEYERMGEEGYFGPDERVELLDGLVFAVTPPLPPHVWATHRIARQLRPVEDRAEVRVQAPVAISEWSEPEPDVSVVPLADYRTEHPAGASLVIEVSYSTVRYDRGIKRRVYAEAGIPEYWIVNLADRVVEVYTDPREGAYASVRAVDEHGTVSPGAYPDVILPVASLLP